MRVSGLRARTNPKLVVGFMSRLDGFMSVSVRSEGSVASMDFSTPLGKGAIRPQTSRRLPMWGRWRSGSPTVREDSGFEAAAGAHAQESFI